MFVCANKVKQLHPAACDGGKGQAEQGLWEHVGAMWRAPDPQRQWAEPQHRANPQTTRRRRQQLGTGGWGGKWEREKKENGGRRGKRRGRTLAARELNGGLFYTVFALCFVLFTKLPLSLSALVLFSVFLRHTHIHNRYTHTHTKHFPRGHWYCCPSFPSQCSGIAESCRSAGEPATLVSVPSES